MPPAPAVVIAPPPPTAPATAPAPATEPATKPAPPPETLLDVVRREQQDYPTTQPLELPADLPDAARIELTSPVYLDAVGNLWITDPRGRSVQETLAKWPNSRTLVVREKIVFVSWTPDADKPVVMAKDADGIVSVYVPAEEGKPNVRKLTQLPGSFEGAVRNGYDLVIPLNGVLARFIGLFDVKSTTPLLPDFIPLAKGGGKPSFAQSGETVYVWQPDDTSATAGSALSIDSSERLEKLTADNGYADRIIQLVPLADGSVLIVSRGDSSVELKLKPAANTSGLTPEQQTLVATLAKKLADPDPLVREQTQRQLEALGPLVLPELEKLRDTLPPAAQVRIESLLGQRFAPTLAGLHPLEGDVQTLARFRDGGCVLKLVGGGTTAESGDEQSVIPAYVAIRPGRFIQRLDLERVVQFDPAKYKLCVAGDEWVIVDPVAGPQRWIGSKLFPLVDPPLADYDDLVGIDASHRWIFRSSKRPGKTLVIDPALPDTTPRLPTWTIAGQDGCGWTNTDWPAVKHGERIFVLAEQGWRLPEKDERFVSDASAVAPPTSRPTTLPAGDVAAFDIDDLLLSVGPDNSVRRFRKSPASGTISAKPEAVFKDGLPTVSPKRVWVDPAKRLVFAGNQLTVTFPLGRVPKGIGDLMLRSTR